MNDKEVSIEMSKLIPGEIPLDIFNEVARLTVVPVLELVVEYQGALLLLKRPGDDMFWPNKFCLPGGIISSNEKTIEDQIILRCKGLGLSDKNLLEVLFKGVKLVKTNRGVELAVIYNILLGNNPIRNQYSFVDISDINKMDDIIREHKAIINSVYHGINLL